MRFTFCVTVLLSILVSVDSPPQGADLGQKLKEKIASGFKNQKASSLFGEALKKRGDPLAEGWKPPPVKGGRAEEDTGPGPRLGRPIAEEFPDWLDKKERGFMNNGEKKKWPGMKSILKGKSKEKNRLYDHHQPKLDTFDVLNGVGDTIRLDSKTYPGVNVWLLVTVASHSNNAYQFHALQELYEMHNYQGFEIIAFPSNSFDHEPLDNEGIQSEMKGVYGLTFPVMGKCEVNGPDTPKIITWLKGAAFAGGHAQVPDWAPIEKTGLHLRDIHWNFEKFLVIQIADTERVLRFAYDSDPMDLSIHIERALDAVDRKKKEL